VKQTLRTWLKAHDSGMPESWKHKRLGDKQFREFVAPVVRERLIRLERRFLTSDHAVALRQQPCAYCGGPGGTVDHIIPVALGGTDDEENLTSACQSCNSKKGVKQAFGGARPKRGPAVVSPAA
jgi:5-methylcytosine-specific restriction endonuclease McrA